jgi:hypothetical protein
MVAQLKELRPEILSIGGDYVVACFQQKLSRICYRGNMHRIIAINQCKKYLDGIIIPIGENISLRLDKALPDLNIEWLPVSISFAQLWFADRGDKGGPSGWMRPH